jgi:hypothetical protein
MPNQIKKQSPTSQDSGTSVSAERVRMQLCTEKERDGGARTLILSASGCRPRYSPTSIRLALHQAPVAVVGVPGRR